MFGPNLKKIAKWREERNGEALVKAYQEDNLDIKIAVVQAIGQIQHRAALPLLLQAMKYRLSPTVRAEAIKSLGVFKESSTIKNLIAALGDDAPPVVQAARTVLASMGDAAIVPLRDQLNDFYHESIRRTCAELLKQSGVRATNVLIQGLTEGTYGIREESARLLGEIGDSKGREALVQALADHRIEVRRAAAASLAAVKWTPGKDIYAAHFYVSQGLVDEAAQLGQVAVPAMFAWIHDEDVMLRRKLAIALHQLGWKPKTAREAADFWAAAGKFSELVKLGEASTDTLVRLLSDRNLPVKKGAAKALRRIGVPAHVKSLVRDIELMVETTIFRLKNGTFNLNSIGLQAEHYKGKYYLLKIDNCDPEQIRHIQQIYPEAEIIDEKDAM